MERVQELCRKLKPLLGTKVDHLYRAYLAEDAIGRAELEQTLELLAAKHLGQNFEHDRTPFPPPDRGFAMSGSVPLGEVIYGQRALYPLRLRASRLKEHILICGRSGSGKTNLTFMLMLALLDQGIKVLALDWKRGYRDLLALRPNLHVYTVGRDVAPLRFNPLIPPPGCEPGVWIKLTVDVIASAYLGGEGVISLLISGLDRLYRQLGVYDGRPIQWPTMVDLLAWLRTQKLRGRAAMWQASAERILLALTYGEFGRVVDTQDNSQVEQLLDHDVVIEMDGLSGNSDRTMFSEALTLWLYRLRLAHGPQAQLTNMIVLEEAHNLLLAKQTGARESVLESSIRQIRQYGLGYVFVDQSASMLSKVAFANSYATIALSQKLAADVRSMSGAMNLTDEQKQALSTLPVGSAVVRLADEHPEPFLIHVPRCPVTEGQVTDADVRIRMAAADRSPNRGCYTDSRVQQPPLTDPAAIPAIPSADRKTSPNSGTTGTPGTTHPPVKATIEAPPDTSPHAHAPAHGQVQSGAPSPPPTLSREAVRFLADVASRPLSTTVARYQRLHLSRRRGNAVRQQLSDSALIAAVPLATRAGQVVLYQLTELGRLLCGRLGIDAGPRSRTSLEHRYWVQCARAHFEEQGYEVTEEHVIKGNGAVDLLAAASGQRLAIEVETGKSKIAANIQKVPSGQFDKLVIIATSPQAVERCQKVLDTTQPTGVPIELLTWLDLP